MKTCKNCLQVKIFSEFGKRTRAKDGLCSWCKECTNTKAAKRRLENREHVNAIARKSWMKRTPEQRRIQQLRNQYNMTKEQYDLLLEEQQGSCAICDGQDTRGYNLSVDHDHSCCPTWKSCGKCIRGLLCQVCNKNLGAFHDEIRLFEKAIDYLKRYNSYGS